MEKSAKTLRAVDYKYSTVSTTQSSILVLLELLYKILIGTEIYFNELLTNVIITITFEIRTSKLYQTGTTLHKLSHIMVHFLVRLVSPHLEVSEAAVWIRSLWRGNVK